MTKDQAKKALEQLQDMWRFANSLNSQHIRKLNSCSGECHCYECCTHRNIVGKVEMTDSLREYWRQLESKLK